MMSSFSCLLSPSQPICCVTDESKEAVQDDLTLKPTRLQAQALHYKPHNIALQQAVCILQVYKARWHGTLVAVKVLKSEDPDEAEAFSRETSILENLHHLHVVAYYDHIVTADGTVGLLPDALSPCSGPTSCRMQRLRECI